MVILNLYVKVARHYIVQVKKEEIDNEIHNIYKNDNDVFNSKGVDVNVNIIHKEDRHDVYWR